MKKITLILFIIVVSYFIFNDSNFCQTTEKRLKLNGNSFIEVIFKIKNCGATSGYLNKVYILKKGDTLSFLNNPIIELNDDNPILYWSDNKIIIESNTNRIYNFTNFEYIDNVEYNIVLKNNK